MPTIAVTPTIEPANPKFGDTAEIICKAEGRPAPTVQFKKVSLPPSLLKAHKVKATSHKIKVKLHKVKLSTHGVKVTNQKL